MPNPQQFLKYAFRAPLIFIAGCGVGYGTGYYLGKANEQKRSNTPDHAVSILQNQPDLSWRLKYFAVGDPSKCVAGDFSKCGRDGLWVSRFQPRFTGTAAYIVFHAKETKQTYLLLTVQERVINQQKVTVCEPPVGFFNGEYPSAIPHIVAESAEREIEKQIKLGRQNISHPQIYADFMQQYTQGKLSTKKYVTDKNTLKTAYREIEEEAGLDITALQQQDDITVSQQILGTMETPTVLSVVRQINIAGKTLPALAPRDNNEVKQNEWILLTDIDLATKTVKTSRGIFPLKPYDNVCEDVSKILADLAVKKPQHKLR